MGWRCDADDSTCEEGGMSKVWEVIKQVERERELAGRQQSSAARQVNEPPIRAYLVGVRRRCQERSLLRGASPDTSDTGKPPR
jgi:hypothetical protein